MNHKNIKIKIVNLRYLKISSFIFSFTLFFVLYSLLSPNNGYPTIGYFTTQSNIVIMVFFLISIIINLLNKKKIFEFWHSFPILGAVTTWITLTCLIFNTVLIKPVITSKDMLLYNKIIAILTHIIPNLSTIYFFVTYKFIKKPNLFMTLLWFIYPYIYCFITLFLGSKIHQYPYFFLDLNNYSLLGVMGWVFLISLIMLPIIFFYYWIAKRKYLSFKITNKLDKNK